MSTECNKLLRNFQKFLSREHRLETGFSMLEAVVVVGVLLALAVGGFLSYGPITDNAKMAKAKSAASEVYTGVLVAAVDGEAETTPQKVIDNWNASTDKIKVTLSVINAGSDDYCVSATIVESPSLTAQSGSCENVESLDPTTGGDPTPEPDGSSDGTAVTPTEEPAAAPEESTTPTPTPSAPIASTPPADQNSTGATITAHPSYTSYFQDETALTTSSTTETFVFGVSEASDYTQHTVEWFGTDLDVINGSINPRIGSPGVYWVGDVNPADSKGWREGTGFITAKVTNISSGASSFKTWKIVVSKAQLVAAGGATQYFSDQTVTEQSKSVAYNVATIPGAMQQNYVAEWSIGNGINAKVTGRISSNSSGNYWVGDITHVDNRGFVEGVAPVTLKLTHTPTGDVFTKSWNFNVIPGGVYASASYPALFQDQTFTAGSTATQYFVYTLPGAVTDYSVTYSGTNNAGVNTTLAGRTNSTNKYWTIDVKPGTGGFKVGVNDITATVTHIPTGEVYTKVFKVTVK